MSDLAAVDEHVVGLLEAELMGSIARQQEALGLNNTEMAERAGVNRMTVQRAREVGAAPRLSNVIAMALAVGLTPALLARGENAVQLHEANRVHRGLHHNRLKRDGDWKDVQRETALARGWEKWNAYENVGHVAVMSSLIPNHDQAQASAAASAIQWLGSDVGFEFLKQALDAAGYDIVERGQKPIRKGQARKKSPLDAMPALPATFQ